MNLIKINKIYLLSKLIKKFLTVLLVFASIVIIINYIEESNFLNNTNATAYTSLILTFLNTPSLLFEMMPFIFLISTQLFFIELINKGELNTLKSFGLNNINILNFLAFSSLLAGILIVLIFYNFSSILKNQYLKIKNEYTKDGKYLAVITKNGLWIRDSYDGENFIVNAEKIQENYLLNASITKFDKNFEMKENIISSKIDIKNNIWILHNAVIMGNNNFSKNVDQYKFNTNFNFEKINSLFSDLTSLTFFGLSKLKKDYQSIGYSLTDIEIQKHKLLSFPIFLSLMSIIASIIMINIKYEKKSTLVSIFVGVILSASIYYATQFSNLLGLNGKIPVYLSVWFPIIIIMCFCSVTLININEK